MEIALRGIGVSPGIAIGPVLPFDVHTFEIPKYRISDSAEELQRLDTAVAGVRCDLERLHQQTADSLGKDHADIFKVHLMLLDDVTIREDIESRLSQEGFNIEYLLDDLLTTYAKTMRTVSDARFRERTNDLLDVGKRILGKLLNTELASLEKIEHPSVVVAYDLSPSETANIDVKNALGIATDIGGPTSHTAILARALEIPAVVGLRYACAHVKPGDMAIIDGTNGYVFIRPDASTLAEFTEQKGKVERKRRELLEAEEAVVCKTLDGYEFPLMANIELPVEVTHSLKVRVQGVGLYRTEYLFLNRTNLPSEQEQFQAYAQVAAVLKPRPVTLRTLDIGGDKLVSHLQLTVETNPQLGWRAIRFCLERPDIFKAQLRAMFRASVYGNVQIMFPLISGLEEMRQVKHVVDEVRADLARRGVAFDQGVKIGTMIEVPSAVVISDLLAKECDFFSIGTNDLIQYSLAVDRVNEKIAHMYEPAHPAILRMIQKTVKSAKAAGIPCSLCGEMAGDPLFTELLLGLGVDSLSMSAVAIPAVHAEIANTRMSSARAFARNVLAAKTATDVRGLLQTRFQRKGALERYLSQLKQSRHEQGE
ncbi:MAG: phosphoenolpyruvate--protein phosphotransferase [Candidatus Hydrogenedentes bacterium]|nr:phosphoenolpyruvate--protein phosphotransferase [Candidatus Hydrogenedentota bacterium]